MLKKRCPIQKKYLSLQLTLVTRAPSPATDAGVGARVTRQDSEITVSYIEAI